MKASKALSAWFLVSAIQISWRARFAFECWLLGSLLSTFRRSCAPNSAGCGSGADTSSNRLPEAERAVGDGEFGRDREPAPFEVK